jgi:hypothetical protein
MGQERGPKRRGNWGRRRPVSTQAAGERSQPRRFSGLHFEVATMAGYRSQTVKTRLANARLGCYRQLMIERGKTSGPGEEDISPFDAANYSYQMTAELRRMAREGGLEELAGALDRAWEEAAKAMVQVKRPD